MEIVKRKKPAATYNHVFDVTFSKEDGELTAAQQKQKVKTWLGQAMLFAKSFKWLYLKPHLEFVSTEGHKLLFIVYRKVQ